MMKKSSGSIDPTKKVKKLTEEIEKLKSEIFQLKNIIDNLPGDIYWKNFDGVWSGVNMTGADTLLKMQFIQNRNDVIGKTDYQIFNKETADMFRNNDLDVMQNGIEITKEETNILPSGHKIVQLSTKKPLRDEHGNICGIIGNTIDITHLKKIESDLKIAKEAAESANHAKTEFIANMSHDIRTPLTGVVGLSKMIEDNATDPTQKKYAHLLNESGDELLKMLNDILDVVSADNANENDLHEEPFSLHHMIEEIEHLECPTTYAKGIDFIKTFDEHTPPCFIGDHTKIHRILLNLLGNAIKFTEKGRVQVEMNLMDDEDTHAIVQFRVSDTGIGIPPEMQDKVFDRFFRVSPSYRGIYTGHGVGLHIAQSYAHLLGSDIQLTSQPGVGTTFFFILRLKKGDVTLLSPVHTNMQETIAPIPTPLPSMPDHATNPQPAITTASLPDNAPHVLLVEDNPIALMILNQLVTNAGCNVTTAEDGEIAYDLCIGKSFDLIITDLGLPKYTGTEFTTRLRAFEVRHQKRPVPIIGLTAHANDQIKHECLVAGMNNAFPKPITQEILEKIISTYLSTKESNPSPEPKDKPITHHGKLGLDLPDTEEALFQLDAFTILDVESAAVKIGFSIDTMKKFLVQLIEEQMPKDLKALENAHAHGDWNTIEKVSHRMKGGLLSFGTDKLVHACQYLERYHKAGHGQSLEKLYNQVMQVSVETTLAIQTWLSR